MSAVPIHDVFMALGIVLTNNEYTDEMAHYHLSLHCLSQFPIRGFQYTKV